MVSVALFLFVCFLKESICGLSYLDSFQVFKLTLPDFPSFLFPGFLEATGENPGLLFTYLQQLPRGKGWCGQYSGSSWDCGKCFPHQPVWSLFPSRVQTSPKRFGGWVHLRYAFESYPSLWNFSQQILTEIWIREISLTRSAVFPAFL